MNVLNIKIQHWTYSADSSFHNQQKFLHMTIHMSPRFRHPHCAGLPENSHDITAQLAAGRLAELQGGQSSDRNSLVPCGGNERAVTQSVTPRFNWLYITVETVLMPGEPLPCLNSELVLRFAFGSRAGGAHNTSLLQHFMRVCCEPWPVALLLVSSVLIRTPPAYWVLETLNSSYRLCSSSDIYTISYSACMMLKGTG